MSARDAGDPGSIPGSVRSPGEGNGNPLQYSCLENSMDGGAWRATVHGVTKSWTWLNDFTHWILLALRNSLSCQSRSITYWSTRSDCYAQPLLAPHCRQHPFSTAQDTHKAPKQRLSSGHLGRGDWCCDREGPSSPGLGETSWSWLEISHRFHGPITSESSFWAPERFNPLRAYTLITAYNSFQNTWACLGLPSWSSG